MSRKPNYRFERSQRAKNKADKKAARLEEKARKTAERKGLLEDGEAETYPSASLSGEQK